MRTTTSLLPLKVPNQGALEATDMGGIALERPLEEEKLVGRLDSSSTAIEDSMWVS